MANPIISGQNMLRIGNLATDELYVSIIGGSVSVAFPMDTTTAAPGATATGMVVRVAGSVPVAVSGLVPVTTQASVSIAGLPVWFSPGAVVAVSGVVPVTTAASVSVAGIPVWLNPTQQVAVGAISVSGIVPVTTQASVSVGGLPVWFAPGAQVLVSISVSAVLGTVITVLGTQIVTLATAGSVAALDVGRTLVQIVVTSTVGVNAGVFLMTVYTGAGQAPAVAGASLWPIPAGKTFRIVGIQAVMAGSAVVSVNGGVLAVFATSAATVTVSAIGGQAAQVGFAAGAAVYGQFGVAPAADIPATQTVGVGLTVNTNCLIGAINVQGYLFP